MGTIIVAERFCGGITEAEKRQLFDEHITWYQMYGMSMRPVPKSWEEFQEYWDHMCTNVLEDNKATRDVLDLTTLAVPPLRAVDPQVAVGVAAAHVVAVLCLVHGGVVRPAGAKAVGLHLV